MRLLRPLWRDDDGATIVETTIVFPMVLMLMFGLVEFGHALWDYHMAEKATAIGARWIAAGHGLKGALAANNGELYQTQVPDCFVSTSATPGTPCSQVAGATGWSLTCSGTSGAPCNSAQWTSLVTQMRQYAPFISASNVSVTFRGSNLGFVGRSRSIPLISVRTTGLTYNFIAIDKLLNTGPLTMPGFTTTLVGEDQKQGPGI